MSITDLEQTLLWQPEERYSGHDSGIGFSVVGLSATWKFEVRFPGRPFQISLA